MLVTPQTAVLELTYDATGGFGVGSYDVGVRFAPYGTPYGPWEYPADWQRTKARRQVAAVEPGGQTCFRVRATDTVGHRSGWLERCVAAPFDDRELKTSGDVDRVGDSRAMRVIVRQLSAVGAEVRAENQTGRQVALVVVRGPGQGAVDVFVGKTRLGRVSLAADKWARAVLYLPAAGKAWQGTVYVRSVRKVPSRIDGIAVLR